MLSKGILWSLEDAKFKSLHFKRSTTDGITRRIDVLFAQMMFLSVTLAYTFKIHSLIGSVNQTLALFLLAHNAKNAP